MSALHSEDNHETKWSILAFIISNHQNFVSLFEPEKNCFTSPKNAMKSLNYFREKYKVYKTKGINM